MLRLLTLVIPFLAAIQLDEALAFSQCSKPRVDIVILLDASSSIGDQYFNKIKASVINLLRPLTLSEDGNRVAIVPYADSVNIMVDFNNGTNTSHVLNVLNKTACLLGQTATGNALSETRTILYPQMRKGAGHVVLLYTDGYQRVGWPQEEEATKLKKLNVTIQTVAIGKDVNKDILAQMSSNGKYIKYDNVAMIRKMINKSEKKTCTSSGHCPKHAVDVIFLLDVSGSIGQKYLDKAKDAIRHLLKRIPLSENGNRAVVIPYGDITNITIDFNNGSSISAVLCALDQVRLAMNKVDTSGILSGVRAELDRVVRNDATQILLLYTDGLQNKKECKGEVLQMVEDVRELGDMNVTVQAVATTDYINKTILNRLSTSGKYIEANNIEELIKIVWPA